MKVKICGVCRPEDAAAAAAAGASFVGVILAPGSPRTQTAAAAREIFGKAGGLQRAGVFANQPVEEVASLAISLGLDVIQLHGDENSTSVAAIAALTGLPVWKTVWLGSEGDLDQAIEQYAEVAAGFLLDAAREDARGGTGTAFDWELARHARRKVPAELYLVVAGGLTPDNVGAAVSIMRPDVVDVSSGVEQTVGIKSHERINSFTRNATA